MKNIKNILFDCDGVLYQDIDTLRKCVTDLRNCVLDMNEIVEEEFGRT